MKHILLATVVIATCALTPGVALADDTKSTAERATEKLSAQDLDLEKRARVSRSQAKSAVRALFDTILKDYEGGGGSLERLIFLQRQLVEIDTPNNTVRESLPGIFARHLELATRIESITKAHVEAGKRTERDLQFAQAHQKVLSYEHAEAEAKLISRRRR